MNDRPDGWHRDEAGQRGAGQVPPAGAGGGRGAWPQQPLLAKATGPGVYLNPFTALPFGSAAAGSVSVDQGTHLYNLVSVAMALGTIAPTTRCSS